MEDVAKPARIEPDGVYSDGDVRLLLGLSSATLARARRNGALRFSRQGNSLLYRGTWLLQWLENDADARAHESEVSHDA
ncbi:MAG: helix-turn-helix domain-containing protein [Planctomycetales bacterium]